MARKLRLEFPGACYHVINRGNYRSHIFREAGAKAAFEACVFEACAKSGWRLHAFVVLGNHYHLAVETPEGNLVAGMQWLQATFANRFNRLRGERGHLFQGRYKALLVEPGAALGQVCHYIHLNPVRAGLVSAARLGEWRHSSYWWLGQKVRPEFLRVETALAEAGGLADTPAGRTAYADYLAWQAASGPAGKNAAYARLSQGWALGTPEFKAALIQEHALAETSRAWEASGAREIRETKWAAALSASLRALGKTEADLRCGPQSAPWKVAVALHLKERTQATNLWLAQRLGMSRPAYVSRLVSGLRLAPGPSLELTQLRDKCAA
jgi:putative transposase